MTNKINPSCFSSADTNRSSTGQNIRASWCWIYMYWKLFRTYYNGSGGSQPASMLGEGIKQGQGLSHWLGGLPPTTCRLSSAAAAAAAPKEGSGSAMPAAKLRQELEGAPSSPHQPASEEEERLRKFNWNQNGMVICGAERHGFCPHLDTTTMYLQRAKWFWASSSSSSSSSTAGEINILCPAFVSCCLYPVYLWLYFPPPHGDHLANSIPSRPVKRRRRWH